MKLGQRASTKAQEGTYLQVPMPDDEDEDAAETSGKTVGKTGKDEDAAIFFHCIKD